ncbi:ABC transporter permease, partial [Candidatus Woesebacteria bacterium]|nr:ABC transporter permease [Candidatus Woesebacteria bacterium]
MKTTLIHLIRMILTPMNWVHFIKHIIKSFPQFIRSTIRFFGFFTLLIFFLFGKFYFVLERIPILKYVFIRLRVIWNLHFQRFITKIMMRLQKSKNSEINRSYLIKVGYKNLLIKKTRTLITIAGMSVGVGIIVLLLSLGYGIEKLIISQVASLDELKIIDVTTGGNTQLQLDKNFLSRIQKISSVDTVMPVVSLVGRITFNNAKTDVLAYSASNRYLESTNVKLLKGKLFSSNEKYVSFGGGDVAGASTAVQFAKKGDIASKEKSSFNILPDTAAYLWSSCSMKATLIGRVPRIEGGFTGQLVWGSNYYPFSNGVYDSDAKEYIARWVKALVPVYYEIGDGTLLPKINEYGGITWQEGCMQESELQITGIIPDFGEVLGDATTSAELVLTDTVSELDSSESGTLVASDAALLASTGTIVSTDSAGLEVVSLEQNITAVKNDSILKVKGSFSKEAVVSRSLLDLLGISLNDAVSKNFKVSFIVTKSLIPTLNGKATTEDTPYTIIGVTDDVVTPYFYIPLRDIDVLGVNTFSQVKVVMKDQNALPQVRKDIEAMGFRTSSTLDTVSQIENLFANLRIVLGLLGLVALAVASLGMFNTLTVSLLERTREIGGMKTMGMVSDEVQDLFLSEAMIMGLAGGVGGLFFGYVIGKTLSIGVSVLAVFNGQGFIELTYIPPFLIIFVLISSFIVGTVT